MQHTFALTTRQVAKLGKSEIPPVYMSVKRYGNWRGVTPSKTATGRFLWRSDEVYSALGLVPDQADMTHPERFYSQFLEDAGLAVTGEAWSIGQALLSSKSDEGRDPSLFINEASLIVEVVSAFANRLAQVLPMMDEPSRGRARACLGMISKTAESFFGEEVDCA